MTRVPYHTYVEVAPDGRIAAVTRKIGASTSATSRKVECDGCEQKLRQIGEHNLLWRGDHLEEKPRVHILPHEGRNRILADDEDVLPIHFTNVPPEFTELRVVCGDQTYQLPVGETLDLTCDTFGTVRIGLREPCLRADDIVIIADLPGRSPE